MGGWESASWTNTTLPVPLCNLLLLLLVRGQLAPMLGGLLPWLSLWLLISQIQPSQLHYQEAEAGAARGLPLLLLSLWASSFAQL